MILPISQLQNLNQSVSQSLFFCASKSLSASWPT